MNFLKRIKRKLFKKKKKSLPIFDDDKFLVSYPKSGNTWARFVIANLLKSEDGEIDFHKAVLYVPEYGVHNDVISKLPRPRILKSHEVYRSEFRHVVYLVRDPRDVYVSYYHYLKKKLPEGMDFSAFLRSPDIHPCRWHDHVLSWIDKPNVAVFRYEDLIENPIRGFQEIAKVLNIPVSDELINRAVRASSFDEMKRIESDKGRPFKNEDDKRNASAFVRKGTKGDWKNHFSADDLRFLANEAGDVATRLGYSIGEIV